MIITAHKDFVDYYRLLKSNYAKGTRFFKSILLQPALATAFISNYGALQVLYTGIDHNGVYQDPNAADLLDALNASAYADQAWLNYLTFLGITPKSTVEATVANTTTLAAILASESATAALMGSQNASTYCVTNATAWSYILNNATAMTIMKASYYFLQAIVANVSTGIATINAIRNNATARAAFNTNRSSALLTDYTPGSTVGAVLALVIHAGGAGGRGGYYYSHYCSSTANHGSAGATGYNGGSAGRTYYVYNASYANYDAGGGGGRGAFGYVALRCTPGTALTISASATSATYINGYSPQISNSDQTKCLVTIGTNDALTKVGTAGYGYDDIGTITGSTGTTTNGTYPAGGGGQGYGAGGGGGGGAASGSQGNAGGNGASGCVVIYRK